MRRASERIFGVVFERENMLSVSVRKYEERNIMKTTLLIMAAGIGSRFGTGIKQLEPVDASNRIIMDYSIHDAIEAGFNHVVFIIRKDIEKEFKEVIGDRIAAICADHQVTVDYAFQDSNDIPGTLPEGRTKPWGTGQAVRCCKGVVNEPFAVINADDYYGRSAFEELYRFLTTHHDDEKYRYAMVGYQLGNTLTDNGSVARGICVTDENGYLQEIAERTKIVKTEDGAAYTEDDGKTWIPVGLKTPVSMNMWAFSPSIINELQNAVDRFFAEEVEKNPLKSECFLPIEVDKLLKAGKATVEVLHSADKWFGVTYKEDKPFVMESIQKLKDAGVYPDVLW